MPFDPFAFLDPDQAFSEGGLLSHELFEACDNDENDEDHDEDDDDDDEEEDDDQDTAGGTAFLDGLDADEAEEAADLRVELAASGVDSQLAGLVQRLNTGCLVAFVITPAAYQIVSVENEHQSTVLYTFLIDDGPPLSRGCTLDLALGIEEKIEAYFGEQITMQAQCPDNSEQITLLLVSKLWVLTHSPLHLTFDFGEDADPDPETPPSG